MPLGLSLGWGLREGPKQEQSPAEAEANPGDRPELEAAPSRVCSETDEAALEDSESEVAQSCLTLCDPVDCSPPGSSIHGILQARILEWIAISFSRGDLPDPGIEPRSPTLWADALTSEPPDAFL